MLHTLLQTRRFLTLHALLQQQPLPPSPGAKMVLATKLQERL
jgi:hypothetical protein